MTSENLKLLEEREEHRLYPPRFTLEFRLIKPTKAKTISYVNVTFKGVVVPPPVMTTIALEKPSIDLYSI